MLLDVFKSEEVDGKTLMLQGNYLAHYCAVSSFHHYKKICIYVLFTIDRQYPRRIVYEFGWRVSPKDTRWEQHASTSVAAELIEYIT